MLFPPAIRAHIDRLAARFSRLASAAGEGSRAPGGIAGSSEFAGHAPYMAGDDLRRVDWAAFGRLGKLYLKQFAPERERVLTIAPDLSASMSAGEPRKRDAALHLCAALSAVALKSGIAVELALRGGHTRVESYARMGSVYDVLENAGITPTGFIDWASRALAGANKPRNTVLVSDLFEQPQEFSRLLGLGAGGRRLSVVGMLAPDELSPGINGATKLLDLEGGSASEVDIDERVLAVYREELERHVAAWRAACSAYRIPFVLVTSAAGLDELFLEKLPSGGVVV